MGDVSKIFSLLATVFLLLAFFANINPRFPRIPGDLYIDRPGLRIYIPFVSAIVISAALTLFFNFFRK